MPGINASVFRFADVEVREREFSLTKAGDIAQVEPKAFRVLLFLLHNPQKLIKKKELLDAVWGETAVSENSLTRSIALLRHLLGDDTHQPRFIATVATVGYRWVCPVEVVEDEHGGVEAAAPGAHSEPAANDVGTANEAVPATMSGRVNWAVRRRWLIAAIVVAVGLLVLAIWYVLRPLPLPRVTEYTQIIHDTHQKTPVGTDGVRLYFNDYYGPNPLGQSAISGGEISHIPVSVPGPTISDVSPDGSRLLVISDKLGLWSLRILDGSLRHLADDRVRSAAWSPDGKSVVYCTVDGVIKVERSDGTDAHNLVATQDGTGRLPAYGLKWSPDGSKIRFTLNYKIWEVSSDGSNFHPLMPAWQPLLGQCCGNWTVDGKFFMFLSQDSLLGAAPALPRSQMWILDERRGVFRSCNPPGRHPPWVGRVDLAALVARRSIRRRPIQAATRR
jgi:DNA-binding winged helix-turn-helix (wHTH) protein